MVTDPRAAAEELLTRIAERDDAAAGRMAVRVRCDSDRTVVMYFLEALDDRERCSTVDRRRGFTPSIATFGARARYDAWRTATVLVAGNYGMSFPSETRRGVIAS